jgi:bacterioferritin
VGAARRWTIPFSPLRSLEKWRCSAIEINQYFLHGKMCNNWGYFRLGAHYRKESIEEMVHAEKLIDRILFLDGTPNMTDVGKINVGTNVKSQFESDLALEMHAVKHLNQAIKVATEVGDNASRALFEDILFDEEEHVDYLEGQLHAIDEMGIENYLATTASQGRGRKRVGQLASC